MDYREWKALRQRSVITLYIRTKYIYSYGIRSKDPTAGISAL